MNILTSKLAKGLIVVTAVSALVVGSTVANAAKTITCYKGTAVKKVTTAKCPTGYTTTKPKAVPTKPVAGGSSVALTATYKGTIKMVWSDSAVTVTSVSATGSGTTAGLDSLSGTGGASPSSQCDSINGSGVLGSGANTVKVSFDTAAQGCSDQGEAPAVVSIKGNAIVNGGTGKFAGATGTLKVSGSFSIKSTAAGSTESDSVSLAISGTITTK